MEAAHGSPRRGSVFVEFAIALFAFITISWAGIELGRAFLTASVAAEGARIAARDSATHPGALEEPLDPDIFDERYTVIDLDNLITPAGAPVTDVNADGRVDVDDLFLVLPPLHTALRSVMIRENRVINGIARRLLRFPGALFRDPGRNPNEWDLVVKIPDVIAEGATVDVELSKVVWLDYQPATNTVRTRVQYHYQFMVLMPHPWKGPIDPASVVITNPGELTATIAGEAFSWSEAVDYGLGRPGTLRGLFRNGTVHIRQFSVARKDVQ